METNYEGHWSILKQDIIVMALPVKVELYFNIRLYYVDITNSFSRRQHVAVTERHLRRLSKLYHFGRRSINYFHSGKPTTWLKLDVYKIS